MGKTKKTKKKIKTNKVNLIDVSEWDSLVMDTYGRPYSFQQQDGCKSRGTFHFTVPDEAQDYKNDAVPEIVNGDEMGVSFKAWLARDPKQKLNGQKSAISKAMDLDDFDLELWWDRNFYPDVQMIANDLYAKKLLKAGEYVIEIDW